MGHLMCGTSLVTYPMFCFPPLGALDVACGIVDFHASKKQWGMKMLHAPPFLILPLPFLLPRCPASLGQIENQFSSLLELFA